MKTIELNKLFEINYGNKLDLNKMKILNFNNRNAIPFVSRTGNNGIVAYVERRADILPNKKDV